MYSMSTLMAVYTVQAVLTLYSDFNGAGTSTRSDKAVSRV